MLRLVLLVAVIGGLFGLIALTGPISEERVREPVDAAGSWAPVVFIFVSAALAVCFFPGPLLAGAAGFLFGTALGTPLAICASLLGASAAFMIARKFAHGSVDQLAGKRVHDLQAWIERRGFLAILYARLLPGMPFHAISYAAGLSRVKLLHFMLATAIASSPRAFAYVALGGSLSNLNRPEALIAIVVIVAMGLIGLGTVALDRRRGGLELPRMGRRSKESAEKVDEP